MGFRDSAGFISRMNTLIMYIDNIPLLDPLLHYSTIPAARSEIDGMPLWGETNAWPSGRGCFTAEAVR